MHPHSWPHSPHVHSLISSPNIIDQLMSALDRRGPRERKLMESLSHLRPTVTEAILGGVNDFAGYR